MAFTYSWPGTIADSSIDPDSPIDTALMTAIRNSLVFLYEWIGQGFTPAVAHNHDGSNSAAVSSVAANAVGTSQLQAAAVTQAKVASSAIGQAQLKTATTTGSLNNAGTHSESIQLSAAGSYGFGHSSGYTDNAGTPPSSGVFWGRANAGGGAAWAEETTSNDTKAPDSYISLSTTSNQVDYSQRYIQSSPPHDLGDGEVVTFLFLEIDSNGVIWQTWMAPDGPWINNGPTDLRPLGGYTRDGTGIKLLPEILAEHGTIDRAVAAGIKRSRAIERLCTDPITAVEITQEMKRADMSLLPHPFVRPVNRTNTIVLVDPMDENVLGRLRDLQDLQPYLIGQLLHRGDVRIDNAALNRCGPPGVKVCAAKWKLTP